MLIISMRNKGCVIFFIGTTAEYIKVFTVIQELKKQGCPVKVIATGQNEIRHTDIAQKTNLVVDLQLTEEKNIKKNAAGLFSWFFKTKRKAPSIIKEAFPDIDLSKSIFVVHGDTLSTVMGAKVGRKLKARVAHIEAGLRSFQWFTPFPEEIDRCIVSSISNINFAPGYIPAQNLSNARGVTVDTVYNTIADGLAFAKDIPCANYQVKQLLDTDYCVFVFHRQENLINRPLLNKVVDKIKDVSKSKTVVFILHAITKSSLIAANRYDELISSPNIIMLDRVEYFDFMHLLSHSSFVVTDGGSNQEELCYMGKPTLILRKYTERYDGLGQNAMLYGGDMSAIDRFLDTYQQFERKEVKIDNSPSTVIARVLREQTVNQLGN